MRKVKNGVKLTQAHIEQLIAAKQKTGCGAAAFLRSVDDVPKGLNSMTINHWIAGRVDQVNGEFLEFVLEQWPKMRGKVQVTATLRDQLRSEEARTGLGPKRLIGTMDEVPKGLKAITISRWMNGDVETAWCDHVDAALNAYAKIKSGQ